MLISKPIHVVSQFDEDSTIIVLVVIKNINKSLCGDFICRLYGITLACLVYYW